MRASLDEFVKTNVVPPLTVADKPAPPMLKLPMMGGLLATQSLMKVAGDLSSRPLSSRIDVPPIAHAEILSNTVVEIVVNRAGFVLTHTLLSSCGSAGADEFALNLSKTARFLPRRQEDGDRQPNAP